MGPTVISWNFDLTSIYRFLDENTYDLGGFIDVKNWLNIGNERVKRASLTLFYDWF